MELTICIVAVVIAIIAFIFSLVCFLKTLELIKQVEELEEWLNTLTDCTIDALDEFDEEVKSKFNEVFDLFENNHTVHDKMIKMMESLMKTDESLFNYIRDIEESLEEDEEDDLWELIADFFAEKAEEWQHPVDDSDVVSWSCAKVWEDDKYEYWETRETKRFEKGCPRYPECKKEPCKDTCPKKRGRPAKK